MTIHYLQHVPFEGPGTIAAWAAENGHTLVPVHLWNNELLPHPADVDALLVLGGAMSANDDDRVAFLKAELHFLQRYVALKRPVLGICLGAQLLARVLGARVYANATKEIGWWPVQATAEGGDWFPESFTTYHWHGDTFDLPQGTTLLASTPTCRNQAFSIGPQQVALQFHLEVDAELLNNMLAHCGDELESMPGIQPEGQQLAAIQLHSAASQVMLFGLLDRVFVATT